jgi:hypothetical protein
MLFKRAVTSFAHLSAHGQERRAVPAWAQPGSRDAVSGYTPRVAFPATRCFQRTPLCLATSYSERPPLHFYEFMQAVKDELLGRPRNWNADAPAVAPYAWPGDGTRFATGPGGVLRITLVERDSTGEPDWTPHGPVRPGGRIRTRRILTYNALLANCTAAGNLTLGDGTTVPISCRRYSFSGGGAGPGMHGDVAAMQDTDVLVAVHGAGLTNLGFLRPGATVLEVRPGAFEDKNANRFYRPFAVASGSLKWWGLRLFGPLQFKGYMERRNTGNPEKYGRDKDLVVSWGRLSQALAQVLPMAYADWVAAERASRVFTDASTST